MFKLRNPPAQFAGSSLLLHLTRFLPGNLTPPRFEPTVDARPHDQQQKRG
jgi:hypothetical protein